MTTTQTCRPFAVEVPGFPTRHCGTLRSAEAAMGRLMAEAPVGTVGTISAHGAVIATATGDVLGWWPA